MQASLTPRDAGPCSPYFMHISCIFRGCEDFFVYTPSQFVKVDVYDADIGPGLAKQGTQSKQFKCWALGSGTDDHLGHVAGLKVEDLLNSPSQWPAPEMQCARPVR